MEHCEKTGRRLRASNHIAAGICLWLSFENRTYWVKGKDAKADIYSSQEIYLHAQRLLNLAEIPAKVTHLGVSVCKLKPADPQQLSLFEETRLDTKSLTLAADAVSDRYGEFTMVPATMANMQDVILKRVAFGSAREL